MLDMSAASEKAVRLCCATLNEILKLCILVFPRRTGFDIMRASEFIAQIQNMINRRGDRQFTVQIHVNGKPVAEVPRMNLVCRRPSFENTDGRSADQGTLGLDLHLDVPGVLNK